MRKLLLASSLILGGILGAHAVAWSPSPVVTEETVGKDGVTVSWSYDDSEFRADLFQVIVYKMHKASKAENFVLAQTSFDDIESTGTLKKHEERGATWDFIPDCPGWWAKFPVYMQGAMGIDAFQYFSGSDNADIFGGSYLVSPDYDLSRVANPAIKVEAKLANEETSVTGGFALYAWNTNWSDPRNIDYKPIYNNDKHYTDLANTSWATKSETLVFPDPADYTDPDLIEEVQGIDRSRTRLVFYGSGYSAFWIDDIKVSIDLQPGDMVDYGAAINEVKGNTFTIDTSADTPDDYTYAYEIRPLWLEHDDYRDVTTIRFTNYAYSSPRHVIGGFSGIDEIEAPASKVQIAARNGRITISGAEGPAQVFNIAGQQVYNGPADAPIALERGVYIVMAGGSTAKITL